MLLQKAANSQFICRDAIEDLFGELEILGSIPTKKMCPVIWSSHRETMCFSRIVNGTLNILEAVIYTQVFT